jgi:hypothetical protein
MKERKAKRRKRNKSAENENASYKLHDEQQLLARPSAEGKENRTPTMQCIESLYLVKEYRRKRVRHFVVSFLALKRRREIGKETLANAAVSLTRDRLRGQHLQKKPMLSFQPEPSFKQAALEKEQNRSVFNPNLVLAQVYCRVVEIAVIR